MIPFPAHHIKSTGTLISTFWKRKLRFHIKHKTFLHCVRPLLIHISKSNLRMFKFTVKNIYSFHSFVRFEMYFLPVLGSEHKLSWVLEMSWSALLIRWEFCVYYLQTPHIWIMHYFVIAENILLWIWISKNIFNQRRSW